MDNSIKITSVFRIILITGLVFVFAGSVKVPLFQAVRGEENYLQIILVILVSYFVQAAIGIFVLAWLLRKNYPIKKLWVVCVSSILIGVSIPVLILSQFYSIFLFLPYILIGIVLRLFLKSSFQTMISCGIAGLISNFYYYWEGDNLQKFSVYLYEKYGDWISSLIFNFVPDFCLGAGIALGVVLVIREQTQEQTDHYRW